MRKLAIIFIMAVLTPSLVLAWLATRSLRTQEIALERQRSLLYQAAAGSVVKDVIDFFVREQRVFGQAIEDFLSKGDPFRFAQHFDRRVGEVYPLADVGFAVSLTDGMLSPMLLAPGEARRFRLENELFLTSRETAQVFWNGPKGSINLTELDQRESGGEMKLTKPGSKAVSAPAAFRQLIGDRREGVVARFLQDRLRVWVWYRSPLNDDLIFGAQLNLDRLAKELAPRVQVEPNLRDQIVLALLNENSQPMALSQPGFAADWKSPFDSQEIGDYLPHWKVAIYIANPANVQESASTVRLLSGLLIIALLLAIGGGSWLIISDMNRELRHVRQRTDFVSNVSHELKTPLTSIRMFSEMLMDGRVKEPAKQREYLGIITAETARLTRLINNVLDFARLERNEDRCQLADCDLTSIARRTLDNYRPHLESAGFRVHWNAPREPLIVEGDGDALSQALLNLLSNAEKYSTERKEVAVELGCAGNHAELRVLDRGRGVPRGAAEKIFEQFYRAHDALTDTAPGAGLGLTLARQIMRAHGGDLVYSPREGGGSCFAMRLPLKGDA